jgi:GntR family transcriptional regulator
MPIDAQSPIPVFEQVANHIRRAVAAGVYRPGELIPSLRALALTLIVNPNTVQRAYEILEREGLVQARRGVGMVVTEDGVGMARATSARAVCGAFQHGIAIGKAAGLATEKIRGAFEQAWQDGQTSAGSEP